MKSCGAIMRCYFMKDGHISGVAFLEKTTDEDRIAEGRRLFEARGKKDGSQGFEIWDGPRFVYRYPEGP